MIYKNQCSLIKELHVYLGKQDLTIVCRRRLSANTNERAFAKHNLRCEQQGITSIKTSTESHLYWKKKIHQVEVYISSYADFEANIETNISNIGDKRTRNFKQNSVCNMYYIFSELNDVLLIGFSSFPLGYDNLD